ncbi:MAG: molybdenum cofactor biosynthesis protein MoaE [Verrucomicrobiaceae bacterium]
MFSIQDSPLDLTTLRADFADPTCGAVVIFEGLVRNHHEGRDVTRLHYQAHPILADQEGQKIVAETLEKFPLTHALAVHRIGTLEIGEPAVITLTASSHREAAFDANRYLIDQIKARVPIWKHEHYTDGTSEWTSPCPNCGPGHTH